MHLQNFEQMPQNVVWSGKTQPPVYYEIIHRDRLFELIQTQDSSQFFWVWGPGGSGKTTLISSYLRSRSFSTLWYRIDSGDADPATFFYYFGQSVQRAFPQKKSLLHLLTPEYVNLDVFSRRFFNSVFTGADPHPLTVVFDNFQEISNSSQVHDALRSGLEWIPPAIRFLFISRKSPPPAFSRLRIIHGLGMLDPQDLLLDFEEAKKIAELRKVYLSDNRIRDLMDKSRGWLAGYILLLEGEKRGRRNRAWSDGNSSYGEIYDYFAGELFDRANPEIQTLLLQTSFLDVVTASSAETLTGLSNSAEILASLHESNLFTEKMGTVEPEYRYHPLLQDFLQLRARKAMTPEKFRHIMQQSSSLQEQERPEMAAELLVEIEDWDGMKRLVLANAQQLLHQGRFSVLRDLIAKIPERYRSQDPWIQQWLGVSELPIHPLNARNSFEHAYALFERADDLTGKLLSWCGVVESIFFSCRDFPELDQWIARLREILDDNPSLPPEIMTRVASGMTIALVQRMGDADEIRYWGEMVLAAEKDPALITHQVHTLIQLSLNSIYRGNYKESAFYLSRLKKRVLGSVVPPLFEIQCCLCAANYEMFTGRHDECLRAVDRGLEVSNREGIPALDSWLLCHAAMSSLDHSELNFAKEFIDRVELSYPALNQWDEAYFALIKARLSMITGDLNTAFQYNEIAQRLEQSLEIPFMRATLALFRSVLHHKRGERNRSEELLHNVLHIADRLGNGVLFYLTGLCEARFALDRGDQELCKSLLALHLGSGRRHGYLYNHVDDPADTAELFAFAIKHGIEVDYVREMIKRRRLVPKKPPQDVEEWPWACHISTLGRFVLKEYGKRKSFEAKAPQKSLELLKVLIAHKGKEVPIYMVEEILWPDADGDAARSAFKTTLYRLRKMFAQENILTISQSELSLNPFLCWLDVWCFFELVSAYERHGSERRADLERAFALYKGPFLPGEEEPWAVSFRNTLRAMFQTCVRSLVKTLEDEKDWSQAAQLYEQAIRRDNLPEFFYQGLMRCYFELGLKAEALTTYERCRSVLLQQLNIKPSSRTRSLRERVEQL